MYKQVIRKDFQLLLFFILYAVMSKYISKKKGECMYASIAYRILYFGIKFKMKYTWNGIAQSFPICSIHWRVVWYVKKYGIFITEELSHSNILFYADDMTFLVDSVNFKKY